MTTQTVSTNSILAGTKRKLILEQGIPAGARVPVALLQFVAFALTARAAGEVAFGLLVFVQTAARLTTASAIRGGAPLMLTAFASMPVDAALRELKREIRSSVRFTAPLWGLLVGWVTFTYELNMVGGLEVALLLFVIVNAAVVLRLLAESTKGAGAPVQSILGEFAPLPVVIFAFLATGLFDGASGTEPLVRVLIALLVAQLIGCVLLRLQLRRNANQNINSAVLETHAERATSTGRLHLSISTTATLALPLMALGATALLGDSESVGRLGAVLRILAPAAILISGIAAGVLPRIARAHAASLKGTTEDPSLAISWLLVSVTSVPYSIVLIAAPSLVEFVYGTQFGELATAMRIVAFGQLINGLTGVAVEVLQITGRERVDTAGLKIVAPVALVALTASVLLDAEAEVSGAVLFTTILAARSIVAARRVYWPILRHQQVLTLENRETSS